VRKDGRLVHLSVTISPVRDARGTIVGASAIYRDITELKIAQEELEQVNESLEERVAERTALARKRAADLRRLASKLNHAEHDERARLARMLHDDVQQLLLAARMKLSHLRIADSQRRQREIEAVEELLTDCLRTSRDLSHELSPAVLQVGTIVEISEWLGDWFGEKHGFHVAVEAEEGIPGLPEHLRVFLFWAVREILFNAVKYSGSSRARVALRYEDARLTVEVADDGERFDPAVVEGRLARGNAFGLFAIRERIEHLLGELEIDRTARGGACFRLHVPVGAALEDER
jgi:signal transduction histidine kinase